MKLQVYIQPGASKTEIVGLHDGDIKIKIKAPPVDGKANDEVIRFFAELLGVAKSKIAIVRGEKSRHKTLEIIGVDEERWQSMLKSLIKK